MEILIFMWAGQKSILQKLHLKEVPQELGDSQIKFNSLMKVMVAFLEHFMLECLLKATVLFQFLSQLKELQLKAKKLQFK